MDVLIVRRDGRTTGEAYVLFGSPMQMAGPGRCVMGCPVTKERRVENEFAWQILLATSKDAT